MALIAAALNFILSLLEVLFSTPPKTSAHDYTNTSQTPQQQQESLQAALDFFELNASTLSRELLKKKFRRYSLLHHPDRNGNTEESKQQMQKVNNFYNILNEELDTREGIHHDYNNDDDENKEPTKQQQENDSHGTKKPSKQAKKRHCRRNETNRKQQMRQEQANIRKQRAQVKREERNMAKHVQETKMQHGLDTKLGRNKAFQDWKQALYSMKHENSSTTADTAAASSSTATPDTKCKETTSSSSSLDDIDDDDDESTTNATESNNSNNNDDKPVDDKPMNLVMDCCLQEIVIGLRMGLTDAVISMIQSELEECITSVISKAHLNGDKDVRESIMVGHIATYFTNRLDDDGNALLHYAVYYENADILSVIYHFAETFDIISQVFLHQNDYGMMAVDYSMGSRDQGIAERMKLYTETAKAQEESKKLLPLLKKSARRFWNILSNVQLASFVRPMSFAISYWIGTRLFGCSRTVSFLLALIPPFSMVEPEEETKLDYKRAYAPTLFAVHWTWRCYRYILGFLPWMTWFAIVLLAMFVKVWRKWHMKYALTASSIPLLLVFAPLFFICNVLNKSLRLPVAISRNDQLERAASLVVFAMIFLLMRHGISYYYGEDDPDMVAEQDGGEFGEQEVVVEPELRTLFRGL